MWNEPRQLNAVSLAVAVCVAALAVWGTLAWLVRQPAFAIREVVITTKLAHASGAHVEAGQFFVGPGNLKDSSGDRRHAC